jgi:hypothetical protein
MWTTEDHTVAAGHSVELDLARWQELCEELLGRVAGRLGRVAPRRHARTLVLGLLSDLPRKNCWTLAVRHEVTWDQWRAHKEVRLMPKV